MITTGHIAFFIMLLLAAHFVAYMGLARKGFQNPVFKYWLLLYNAAF